LSLDSCCGGVTGEDAPLILPGSVASRECKFDAEGGEEDIVDPCNLSK